jgi:WD40 repeat protein
VLAFAAVAVAQDAPAGSLPRRCSAFARTKLARLERVLGRYPLSQPGDVASIAISPDGKLAAVATSAGQFALGEDVTALVVWDLASGEEVATLSSGTKVTAVAFSPEGRLLEGDASGELAVWSIGDRARRGLPGHAKAVTGAALTPDGKLAITSSLDGTVRITDVAAGALVRADRLDEGGVRALALAPDGRSYLAGWTNETTRIVEVATGKELGRLEGHEYAVNVVAFSPDGKVAVTGVDGPIDNTVRCWDLASRKQRWRVESKDGGVRALAFTPDGKSVLVGAWGLHILDVATGSGSIALKKSGAVSAAAIAPDGKRAIAGGKLDEPLAVFDLEAGASMRALAGHEDAIVALGLARDGKRAVTASHDWTVKAWDVEAGKVLATFPWYGDRPDSIAISPDGKRAVAGRVVTPEFCATGRGGPTPEETLLFLDLERMVAIEPPEEYKAAVSAVAISPDGKLAASAGSEVVVWEAATGKRVRVLAPAASTNRAAVRFSSSGLSVVCGDEDGKIEAFQADGSGKPAEERPLGENASAVRALGLDPFVAFANGGVHFGPGKKIETREGEDDPDLVTAALSPDGRTLATSTANGIRLWDRASGAKLDEIPLATARDAATSLAFGPDGKTLLVATKLGVVLRFAVAR